jgi:Protein of unknown function (DUF3618)
MSDATTGGAQADRSPDEIRDDIETIREELGDTVEELAAKTDVQARAQAKAEDLKAEASRRAHESLEVARRNPAPIAAAGLLLVTAFIWTRRGR